MGLKWPIDGPTFTTANHIVDTIGSSKKEHFTKQKHMAIVLSHANFLEKLTYLLILNRLMFLRLSELLDEN